MSEQSAAPKNRTEAKAMISPTHPHDKDELQTLLLNALDLLLRRNHEIETLLSDFRATLSAAVAQDLIGRIATNDVNDDVLTMLHHLQDQLLLYDNKIQKVIYDFWTQLTSEPEQSIANAQPLAKVGEQAFTPEKYTKKHLRYQQLIEQIRALVMAILPPAAVVVVVTKGDEELLKLGRCIGWHFPRNEKGIYAGHHLRDSEAAVAHLEALRAKGGHFFLLPNTAFWWLDYYEAYFHHLDRHYPRIWSDENCIIYQLQEISNYNLLATNARELSPI